MKQLSKLAVRIIALVLMVKSLISLMSNLSIVYVPKLREGLLVSGGMYITVIPLVATISAAIILWVLSDKIASLMTDGEDASAFTISVNYQQLFNLVMKVLGVILVVYAFPNLLSNILNLAHRRQFMDYSMFYRESLTLLLIPFLQVIIGCFIFIKSHLFIK